MKMKQKLAATLAGVMAMSMVPATSVFAYSSNKISKEQKLPYLSENPYKVDEDGNIVYNPETGNPEEIIRNLDTTLVLDVTGAIKTNDTFILNFNKKYEDYSGIYTKEADAKAHPQSAGQFVYLIDGKTVQVKYVGTETLKDKKLEVPLFVKTGAGVSGDITVTVDGNGTAVSSGTYTVASIIENGVTAALKSVSLKENATSVKLGELKLTEVFGGMFKTAEEEGGTQTSWITLKLMDDTVQFQEFGKTVKDDPDKDGIKKTGNGMDNKTPLATAKWTEKLGAIGKLDNANNESVYVSDDGLSLYVPVTLGDSETTSPGYVTVKDLVTIYKDEDVEYAGDVKVRILDGWVENGKVVYEGVGIAETTATILSDKKQAIKVTAAAPTTLVAGRLVEKTSLKQVDILNPEQEEYRYYSNSDHLTAKISIREDAIGSIDKDVKFTFPEGVKVLGYRLSKNDNMYGTEYTKLSASDKTDTGSKNDVKDGAIEVNGVEYAKDKKYVATYLDEEQMSRPYRPQVTIAALDGRSGTTAVDIEFYLSVDADYEGDEIVVEYESTISETFEEVTGELVIAKVEKAVEVSAESTKVDSSLKKQELGDITIKENFAGALVAGGKIYIKLEDGVYFDEDKGTVKVDGDVNVSRIDFECYPKTFKDEDKAEEVAYIALTINEASTKASTITVSGLQTSTKNIPSGYYELQVFGDAIAANDIMNTYVDDITDDDTTVPSESKREKNAKNSSKYFASGTLTVADYVSVNKELLSDNKAPEANNKVETQTVTLKKGDLTYTKADGKEGKMVAAPYFNYDANGGGITMVPIRAIGEILGAEVEWSQATQTATFTMSDGRFAQITLGSAIARTVDGSTLTMNWPAEVPAGVDGGIYAPIRYMARVLGFEDGTVDYDYTNQCVVIQAPVVK